MKTVWIYIPLCLNRKIKENIAFSVGPFAVRKPFAGSFAAKYFQTHAEINYAVHQKFGMTSCKSIADETISFDVSRTIECGGNISMFKLKFSFATIA